MRSSSPLVGMGMHCRAVEGDDWSSVVDGQTAETVAPELVEAQLRAARNPIATPFARASVHRSIGARQHSRLGIPLNAYFLRGATFLPVFPTSAGVILVLPCLSAFCQFSTD